MSASAPARSDPNKETDLLDYIKKLPHYESLRGHPSKILDAIDSFSENDRFLMTIGRIKGSVVLDQLRKTQAKTMIELGGYVGYSAILFGLNLPEGSSFYSFEVNPDFAKIARELIELAGLSEKVHVVVGPAAKSLVKFAETHKEPVGLAFIDHWKELYVDDFRVLETVGLIGKGSVVTADNIITPGAPEYAKYVRLSPEEREEFNSKHENANGKEYPGVAKNKYETETIIFKAGKLEDGVEVTKIL